MSGTVCDSWVASFALIPSFCAFQGLFCALYDENFAPFARFARLLRARFARFVRSARLLRLRLRLRLRFR